MGKFLFVAICIISFLSAEIRELDSLDDMMDVVDRETVVLLDLDETLIELPIMLGGKAWRNYARALLEKTYGEKGSIIHDQISYFLSKNVSYIPVESKGPAHIKQLQSITQFVFGFTARGKLNWYDIPASDAEELTYMHLKQAGYDLKSPEESILHSSYANGIFFIYPIEDKGEFILELFTQTQWHPSLVIFVDDKMSNIRAVHHALAKLHIPNICFYYRPVDLRSFDPMLAHIQLEKLVLEGIVLSNQEARAAKEKYPIDDPDSFFLELISRLPFLDKSLLA
jgi:hypothetical protein